MLIYTINFRKKKLSGVSFFFLVENLAEKNLLFFMLGEKRDVDGGSYSFLFLIDYRNI